MRTWYEIVDGLDPTPAGMNEFEYPRSNSSSYSSDNITYSNNNVGFDRSYYGGANNSSNSASYSSSGITQFSDTFSRTRGTEMGAGSSAGAGKAILTYCYSTGGGTSSGAGTGLTQRAASDGGNIITTRSNSAASGYTASIEFGATASTYRQTTTQAYTYAADGNVTASSFSTSESYSGAFGTGRMIPISTSFGASGLARLVSTTETYSSTQFSYTGAPGSLSTTTVSTITTYTGLGYTADSSYVAKVYGAWNPLSQYYRYVFEAEPGEVLYSASTSGSGIDKWSVDLVSFTRTTITDAASASWGGPAYTGQDGSQQQHQITLIGIEILPDTQELTVKVTTTIPRQGQLFDGNIPPTATVQLYAEGLSTSTVEAYYVSGTPTYTAYRYGEPGRTETLSYMSQQLSTIFFDGIDDVGDITTYSAVTLIEVPISYTFEGYGATPGVSQTVNFYYACNSLYNNYYNNYYHYNYYYDNDELNAINPVQSFGFQDLANYGPSKPRGLRIAANNSFFIGTANSAFGELPGVCIPFNLQSTANNGSISYSLSQDTGGNWSVSHDDGVATGSFIEKVGIDGSPGFYNIAYPSRFKVGLGNSLSPPIFGGATPNTKIHRVVTFEGYAHRYTLRDTSGTTSYSTTLTVPYMTTNIGTSIIAYERMAFNNRQIGTRYYPEVKGFPYAIPQ